MTRAFACVGMLLLVAACDDTDALEPCAGDDGGAHVEHNEDAGARDAGGKLVWNPPDAGQSASAGSGGSGSGATRSDAGSAGTGAAPMCAMRRTPLPSVLLPRCSARTGSCLRESVTADDADACREACIAADDQPADPNYGLDCGGCVYLQLFACIDAAGCHDAVADVFCCLADKCPEGSPEGCGEMRCPDQLMTALTCGYFANMECVDFTTGLIAQCYAGDDADAGI